MNKLFESKTNIGFKYYYFPCLLFGFSLVVLLAIFFFVESINLTLSTLGMLLVLAFLLDVLLYNVIGISRKVRLIKRDNRKILEIKEGEKIISHDIKKLVGHWWSYNNMVDKGSHGASDWTYDESDVDTRNTYGGLGRRGASMPNVLMAKLELNNGDFLHFYYNLSEFENLPGAWPYQVLVPQLLIEGMEVNKLEKLVSVLKAN